MKTLRILLLLLFVTLLTQAQTVYITKTGSKYHTSGCRYLSRSKIAIDLKDAIDRGYTPCSVCKPPTKPTNSSATTKPITTKSGTITTYVDGMDVQKVNLWDHKTERKTVVAVCKDGDKVTILEDDGTYVKLKTANGKVGWCMRGFVK